MSANRESATNARSARKEATQGRILEVAREHFERDGFDAASIRAIAADAEVATGTVLLHFRDKIGLLHAALHDDLEATIARALGPHRGTLLAQLTAVARPFYEYYAARPQLSRVLLRESLFADDPWRARFTEQVARVTMHVAVLVEEAKAARDLPAATDAALLSAAFASFYYFALLGWVQGALPDPLALFKKLMAQHLTEARR